MYYVRDGLYCLSNQSNLVADTINQPNVHNPAADGRRLADCGWFSTILSFRFNQHTTQLRFFVDMYAWQKRFFVEEKVSLGCKNVPQTNIL